MKILFYGAKDYDQQFFDKLKPEYPDIEFVFIESNLYKETASRCRIRRNLCICQCRPQRRCNRRTASTENPSDSDALCRI